MKFVTTRQNVLPSVDEVEQRLAAVAAAFGEDWLGSGDHPLQELWKRKDVLATNQLVWLGDAILAMRGMDAGWTTRTLPKMKSDDANTRKGASFELLGLGMLSHSHRVVPTAANTPGYDGIVHFRDGGRMALSLKNYGASTHEQQVNGWGKRLEETLVAGLEAAGKNGVDVRILATRYPSYNEWQRLLDALPAIIEKDPRVAGYGFQDDVWLVFVRPLAGFDRLSERKISYQLTVLVPHHTNESKNLTDKLEDAAINARKHAAGDEDLCNAVLVHLPENASMVACEGWARDYLAERADSPIHLVLLYQPAVTVGDGRSTITHLVRAVEGAGYAGWQNHGGDRRLNVNFYVGVVTSEPMSRRLQRDDGSYLDGDGYYMMQRGNIYPVFERNAGGGYDLVVSNPAPGIFVHATTADGLELSGIFPPHTDLLLFA